MSRRCTFGTCGVRETGICDCLQAEAEWLAEHPEDADTEPDIEPAEREPDEALLWGGLDVPS